MKGFGILLASVLVLIGGGVALVAGFSSAALPSAVAATPQAASLSVNLGSNGDLSVVEDGHKLMPRSGLSVASGPLPPPAAVDCGPVEAVVGGFRAFVCESGGAGTKYPHPQELLVVRNGGGFSAYPTHGQPDMLARSPVGEVVAAHNGSIVRVARSTITTLVKRRTLDGLFPGRTPGDVIELAVDRYGEVFVALDYYAGVHRGCAEVLAELTTDGKLNALWRSRTGLTCW